MPDFVLHKLQLTPLLPPEPGPLKASFLQARQAPSSVGARQNPLVMSGLTGERSQPWGLVPKRSQKARLRTEVTDLIPSLFKSSNY